MTLDPITNVIIVTRRQDCPNNYEIIDKTSNGDDADLYKDKFFRGKVRRYLCYTRDTNPQDTVVTDMILMQLKEQPPSNFTGIEVTNDTCEQALYKELLCLKQVHRRNTESAITEIMLCKDESYKSKMFTVIGEANNIKIAYKTSDIHAKKQLRPAPAIPSRVQNEVPLQKTPALPQRKPKSCLEGIPFKLNDRLISSDSSKDEHMDVNKIVIRTDAEIDELFSYDFSREKSLLAS